MSDARNPWRELTEKVSRPGVSSDEVARTYLRERAAKASERVAREGILSYIKPRPSLNPLFLHNVIARTHNTNLRIDQEL